jgi:hypothetical protein
MQQLNLEQPITQRGPRRKTGSSLRMGEPVGTGGEERAGHDATAICARVRLYRVQRGLQVGSQPGVWVWMWWGLAEGEERERAS